MQWNPQKLYRKKENAKLKKQSSKHPLKKQEIINFGNLTPETIEFILSKIAINKHKNFMENAKDMAETRRLLLSIYSIINTVHLISTN